MTVSLNLLIMIKLNKIYKTLILTIIDWTIFFITSIMYYRGIKFVVISILQAKIFCNTGECIATIGAFDLGQVTVMLDENFTLLMKNLMIFAC